MSKNFHPFMLSNNTVTIVLDGKQYTYTKTQPFFNELKDMLSVPKDKILWDAVIELIHVEQHLINYSGKNLTVKNGHFFYKHYNGTVLELAENAIITRIIDMQSKNEPFEKMLKFLDNLAENPDMNAINELYLFLEDCELPITDDGHFLAYKKIGKDYKDCYTHTISNKPPMVVTMDRQSVDNNREKTCSCGLHFCAKGYLRSYGGDGLIVAVKINPADVVSIPSDYQNMKGRCCKYQVMDVLDETLDLTPYIDMPDPKVMYFTSAEHPEIITDNHIEEEDVIETEEIKEETTEAKEDENSFATINNPYVGTVKGFLKEVKREARIVDRDYYLTTPLGTSMYKFIKSVSDKAFKFIKKISGAIKKEIAHEIKDKEPPIKKEVVFKDGKNTGEILTIDDIVSIEWHGTVKEFLRKFPKDKRVADVNINIYNKEGIKTYQFVGKVSEKVFKQII